MTALENFRFILHLNTKICSNLIFVPANLEIPNNKKKSIHKNLL